jgi:hypothetical protein
VGVGVSLKEGPGIEVLQDRTLLWSEPGSGGRVETIEPVAVRAHPVHEDEGACSGTVSLRRQSGDAAAPGMTENVPAPVAERLTKRRHIRRVVCEARAGRIGGSLALSASALIVEDQLAAPGERRECRPEEGVIEQQSAVDADERGRASDGRRGEYCELEPPRDDAALYESRGVRDRATEAEISLALRNGDHVRRRETRTRAEWANGYNRKRVAPV